MYYRGYCSDRAYYNKNDDYLLGIILFGLAVIAPFWIYRKIKRRARYSRKSFIERLEESNQRIIEKLHQSRRELWDSIKVVHAGESDEHYIKRLKRWGYTPEGTHIKSGINYQIEKKTEDTKMDIDIKRKLKDLEGETFYTVTGKPYTYEFAGENIIKPSRANYTIHLSNFQRAIEINPTELSEIREVRGPSYVFGIITDSRFN